MIYARPNEPFDAVLEGAPTGLAGTPTLGVRITRPSTATTVLARQTTRIGETPAGSGVYVAALTAPRDAGDYLVLWDTIPGGAPLNPDHSFTEELTVTAQGSPEANFGIRPSLEDIGALLRARTRSDTAGGETGTFNTTTRPTGDEVLDFIAHATAEVGLRLPATLPDHLAAFVRRLAALRAAMLVELSYDPDRTGGQDSAYGRLREQFDAGLAVLTDALADLGEGGPDTGRMVAVRLTTPTAQSWPPYLLDLLLP